MMKTLLPHLAAFDLDFAYLAVLTATGVKPLSRHEGPLPDEARQWLRALGLDVAVNKRRAGSERCVEETVFARAASLVRLYERAFAGAPLHGGAALGRLEGWLFGFPSCCVAAYLEHPYVPNGLPEADQVVLFHWACPGCVITPLLVPAYRDLFAQVQAYRSETG